MAVKLTNVTPRTPQEQLTPGLPVILGLRSETGLVDLGSLRTAMGYTGVCHKSFLPENDSSMERMQTVVSFETAERRRPINLESTRDINAGNLVITKPSNSANDLGVYEITTPCIAGNSALGYLKLKTKTAWSAFNSEVVGLGNVCAPYFGLEYGPLNTGCFAFLRKDIPSGSLVVGGPLQSFSVARPNEQEVAFPWASLPDNSDIEIWVFVNTVGYRTPFSPPNTPLIEVWTRRVGIDLAPVFQIRQPILSFGQFQTRNSGFPNFRDSDLDEVRLFFGNMGQASDEVEVVDWALFHDFRTAALGGEPVGNHAMEVAVNSPLSFRSSNNLLFTEATTGRWYAVESVDHEVPVQELAYNPGNKDSAAFVSFDKTADLLSAVERIEPSIVTSASGFYIEAFIGGRKSTKVGSVLGMGFSVDDGTDLFCISFIESPTYRTIGLLRDDSLAALTTGYYLPTDGPDVIEVDWRTLKLVRLSVDKLIGSITISVDGEDVLQIPYPSALPASASPDGKIQIGHLLDTEYTGLLDVSQVNYALRAKAWESSEALLPPSCAVSLAEPLEPFVEENVDTGTPAISGGLLVIDKESFASTGSHQFYYKEEQLADDAGFWAEFSCKVDTFLGSSGQQFSPSSKVGCGFKALLGSKVLELSFFNCGTNSRVVSVVPGSLSTADILNQTFDARPFGHKTDWAQETVYRIFYKPFDRIEVWAGNVSGSPIITLPWRNDVDGFDLPSSPGTPRIEFGHFEEATSSVSKWRYVRWGTGDGYDVSIRQGFIPAIYPQHFNGKSFSLVEFDE